MNTNDRYVEEIETLSARDVTKMTSRELITELVEIEWHADEAHYLQACCLAELDERGATMARWGLTTEQWWAAAKDLHVDTAEEDVALARLLGGLLKELAEAWRHGYVSRETLRRFDEQSVLRGSGARALALSERDDYRDDLPDLYATDRPVLG